MTEPLVVKLTGREFWIGANIGILRRIENLSKGRPPRYGVDQDDGWTLDIEGACAEMALAKARGVYWNGNLGDLKAADVGALQVRSRTRAIFGGQRCSLIIHPADSDDAQFVLGIGPAPTFTFPGWILGRDGKRQEWWSDPSGKGRPAFFVPQSALHPMEEL